MNKWLNRLVLIIIATYFQACDPENVINESNSKSETELSSDYEWNSEDEVLINLNGTSITESSDYVNTDGTTVTITKKGYYVISGSLTNGQIVVMADSGIVKIKLSNVNVTNNSSAAFYIKNKSKTIIFLENGSVNTFIDASTYTNIDEPNAAFFSNGYLAFTGSGQLIVKGNYNDGISSDDQIIINSGTFNITAKDDAIRAKDDLKIADGIINATATNGHALKSDETDTKGLGFVEVLGGNLNLTSTKADGIHAAKRVIIEGGILTIAASSGQGLRSDSLVLINGGNTNIKASREGVESPIIKIVSGNLNIVATDDGFNATYGNGGESNDNSLLAISGGYTVINASGGDGLDSNGNITMSGGTVIVHGPKSSPEVGIDYNGTFKLSSGFLVVSGTNSNMTQGISASSTQHSITAKSTSSLAASTLFHIQDASGKNIITFKPERAYYSIVFSSESLVSGASYSIYTGGSCSGTILNGLYTDGVYSGGTLKKTFTISGIITNISF